MTVQQESKPSFVSVRKVCIGDMLEPLKKHLDDSHLFFWWNISNGGTRQFKQEWGLDLWEHIQPLVGQITLNMSKHNKKMFRKTSHIYSVDHLILLTTSDFHVAYKLGYNGKCLWRDESNTRVQLAPTPRYSKQMHTYCINATSRVFHCCSNYTCTVLPRSVKAFVFTKGQL